MTPEQILAAMAEAYAQCTSYRDSGRVLTRFLYPDGSPSRVSERPFRTAFVRPGRFRFEFRDRFNDEDEWQLYIVWAEGAEVRTWWHVRPGVERPESLGMAVAGATGVSGGSAHTVPALLLPDEVGGRRLTELADVVSIGDGQIDGATCYRLQGRIVLEPEDPAEEERLREEEIRLTGQPPERAVSGPETVWIDRDTLLIRRIESDCQFETFRTEEVTDYQPEFGATISDDELAFGAPGQESA